MLDKIHDTYSLPAVNNSLSDIEDSSIILRAHKRLKFKYFFNNRQPGFVFIDFFGQNWKPGNLAIISYIFTHQNFLHIQNIELKFLESICIAFSGVVQLCILTSTYSTCSWDDPLLTDFPCGPRKLWCSLWRCKSFQLDNNIIRIT